MAIGPDLATIEGARSDLEALGYAWHGDFGLEGRRFCTLTDPVTGLRKSPACASFTSIVIRTATFPFAGISRSATIFVHGRIRRSSMKR
jgi:hypothetical protein